MNISHLLRTEGKSQRCFQKRPQANHSTSVSLGFPICEMTVANPISCVARLKRHHVYEAVSPVWACCAEVADGLEESPVGPQRKWPGSLRQGLTLVK